MSSYIIAGSADSIDTAYCQEIARRIKSKYKNIDFRIVIKHPSEWEEYLQQICRIYGFLKKSNPIIYTFDGKIIGNKEAFMGATAKYFGLDEQALNVQNLTNQVNMKIATEQVNRKNITKNNIKTLNQKIQTQFHNLLKKNVLKYQLKNKNLYLTNGIEYIHRSVKGLVPNISFVKNKQVKVEVEEIAASDIDLMLISQNDQIKVEQQPLPTNALTTGKQAFVTTNQKNNSEHDKMSEASRTNKMHESIVSYDKDSKQMKESSKSKLRIDEENDDQHDFTDYPMQDVVVAELSDNFFLGFSKNSHITGEMIFYHNEDSNKNILRSYNLGRPVNGHRTLIKQIHFDGQIALLEGESQIIQNQQGSQQNIEGVQENAGNQGQNQVREQAKKQGGSNGFVKSKQENQKIRTQPNIPHHAGPSEDNIVHEDDSVSQIQTELNQISYLNYHTLFAQKPLSGLEIKNLLYLIKDTDCIGCLQFLSENPNPSVKVYHRKFLLDTQKQDKFSLLLPVEKFIEKQLQDHQYTQLQVPNERCYDYESISSDENFTLMQINDIGFEHYLYRLPQNSNSQSIGKMLKYSIDQMFHLEEQLKKHIGYNLVFTRQYILLVPLSEPYEIYNDNRLYFDGLAYLGFVHTAEVLKPYQVNKKEIKSMGIHLRSLLHYCANGTQQA